MTKDIHFSYAKAVTAEAVAAYKEQVALAQDQLVHGTGKGNDFLDIGGADGHTFGVGSDAAIARQGIDFGDVRVLFQALDDAVFTPAAANN